MICPRCRCEAGNQSVCPYCGATIYRRTTAQARPVQRPDTVAPETEEIKKLKNTIQNLDTKFNLLLILSGTNMLLLILLLVALASG